MVTNQAAYQTRVDKLSIKFKFTTSFSREGAADWWLTDWSWLTEWMTDWLNEWMNEQTNERTNERTDERTMLFLTQFRP